MRSVVSKLMIAAVLLLGAQFVAPRANAVDIGGSIGLGVSLDTTYQYVSNGEVGGDIPTRGLYPEHNDFSIDAITLSLEKVPTVGEGVMDQVGFRTDVLFGEQSERLGFGFGSVYNDDGDPTDGAVSPYQAYINVLIPGGGSALNIYAGQFTTLAGWELIEAKDNTNITRSLLFYRIPFAHSGVRATFSAGSLDFALGLSNDWDALDDEDDGKTFESQIALNLPNDGWLGATAYFGDTEGDMRTLLTIVGTIALVDRLTLVGDFEYTSHDWGGDRWGIAGYAIISLADSMSLALRGEYVDDTERTEASGDDPLEFYEFTSTLILTPFESMGNFETRLEYRYDKVDGDDTYFAGEEDQHGFAVQLLYWLDV